MKSKKDVRVLSVKQPWAWFIVNGIKDVENRNNPPFAERVGERTYIHASSRRLTKADYRQFLERVAELKIRRFPKSIDDFDYGSIIGSVVIAGSTRSHKSIWSHRGFCHWLLRDAKRTSPIPLKGQQTLFFRARL